MRLQTFRSAASILIVSPEGTRTTFIFSPGKLHTQLNSTEQFIFVVPVKVRNIIQLVASDCPKNPPTRWTVYNILLPRTDILNQSRNSRTIPSLVRFSSNSDSQSRSAFIAHRGGITFPRFFDTEFSLMGKLSILGYPMIKQKAGEMSKIFAETLQKKLANTTS